MNTNPDLYIGITMCYMALNVIQAND